MVRRMKGQENGKYYCSDNGVGTDTYNRIDNSNQGQLKLKGKKMTAYYKHARVTQNRFAQSIIDRVAGQSIAVQKRVVGQWARVYSWFEFTKAYCEWTINNNR